MPRFRDEYNQSKIFVNWLKKVMKKKCNVACILSKNVENTDKYSLCQCTCYSLTKKERVNKIIWKKIVKTINECTENSLESDTVVFHRHIQFRINNKYFSVFKTSIKNFFFQVILKSLSLKPRLKSLRLSLNSKAQNFRNYFR